MDNVVFTGVSATIPTDLTGLDSNDVNTLSTLSNGFNENYTSSNSYLIYAYDKEFGELISIEDKSGLELINGWDKVEYVNGDTTYLIYYSKEALTINNFKLKFLYK